MGLVTDGIMVHNEARYRVMYEHLVRGVDGESRAYALIHLLAYRTVPRSI